MKKATGALVVLVTFPTARQGKRAGDQLVRLRLAACVNIVASVGSIFLWKGKVERTRECLLVIKTTQRRFEALRRAIVETHPYSVPEIVAIEIKAGHHPYLKWLREAVRPPAVRSRSQR